MENRKEKKKNNEERKIMAIRKDNKWMILLLLKLKIINYFHMGFGTFQSFINSNKRHRIIMYRKVKFGAYQGSHSVLFLLLDFL